MKATIKYISYAVVVLSACISCERAKYLDLLPPTQTVPENFYQNETQFRLATIGVYETINANSAEGTSVQNGSYFGGLLGIMNAPSDELLPSRAQNNGSRVTDMFSAAFTESNPALRSMWDMCYIGINRCNSVIVNAKRFEKDAKIQYCASEAKFMRAFYYWYLAQVFGAVPIAEYQSEGLQPRSKLEDVYKYILKDLEDAYASLSESKTAGVLEYGSANKYTAAAYLGRVCNYLAACKRYEVGKELVAVQPLNDFSWVDAEAMSKRAYECLKDVVDNSGYELISDFSNLFRETTKTDQHKECLFMVENYLNGSENEFPSTQTFMFSPASTGDESKGQSQQLYFGYVLPSPSMFAIFSPKDPRRDWFFTCSQADVNAGTMRAETASDGIRYPVPYVRVRPSAFFDDDPVAKTQTYQPWDSQESCHGCVGKYRFAQLGQSFSSHNRNQHCLSIPLMRFADVKLMYAEAIHFHLDDADETAREQLYDVLLRACKNNINLAEELKNAYEKEDFVEELLQARERELCFEGSRKYDLMRFNLLDKNITALCNTPVVVEGGKTYYGYNSWFKFDDGTPVYFNTSNYVNGGTSLKENWRSYKIWAPISSLQIAANPNLKQNANW